MEIRETIRLTYIYILNARIIFSAFGNNLRMRGLACNLAEISFEDCARI